MVSVSVGADFPREADPIFFIGGDVCQLRGTFEADGGTPLRPIGASTAKEPMKTKGRLHCRTAKTHCMTGVIRKIVPSGKHRSLHPSARAVGRLFEGGGEVTAAPWIQF